MNTSLNTLFKGSLIAACFGIMSSASYASATDDIKAALTGIIGPRITEAKITESAMEGAYQVDLGSQVIFVRQSGDHLLIGDVFNTQRKASLSKEIKNAKVKVILNEMQEASMIVFEPKQTKRTITVYTDVDCPYCRKLHEEVPALVKNGVKVRYLWYPRSGIGSPSYDKAVSIWCADNQTAAMDDAKLNNKISPLKCDPNPVAAHYASGRKVGVNGTPAIVLEDGSIIAGYMPAKNLLANLGISPVEPIANATNN